MHDSGKSRYTGRITKAGRRDLRGAMVDAANHAIKTSEHWKAVFKQMEPRMGRSKAVVAIARKLLVVVWHVLTKGEIDRFADPDQVARLFFGHAYRVGVKNLPDEQSAIQYTRSQLDNLGIGDEVKEVRWGSKRFKLPPSGLPPDG